VVSTKGTGGNLNTGGQMLLSTTYPGVTPPTTVVP